MNTLVENPLPILAVGAMLATFAGLVFLSRRNLPSLVVFSVVILLTLLLVVAERLIVTPREEVEQAIVALITAVEANDLSAVVAWIDPEATSVLSDAETLMAQVRVQDAGATAIIVEVESHGSPTTATARCRGRLRGIHLKTGGQVVFFDQIEFDWVRRDNGWQLENYVVYSRGKTVNAIHSLPGERPAAAAR